MIIDWTAIQTITLVLAALGASGGYLYSQFKNPVDRNATDLILILQAKDKEQKGIITEYQGKFDVINKELGVLQGQLIEKDKKIEEYMAIFQGKSPEQQVYMEDMRKFTAGVSLYMRDTAEILSEVKNFMKELNDQSVKHTQQIEDVSHAIAKN